MTVSSHSHAQWNLVCGNAYIMEIVQPSFLVGAIIGAFVQGPLADRYVNIYLVGNNVAFFISMHMQSYAQNRISCIDIKRLKYLNI